MTDKYGIKEYLKEYKEALEGQPEQPGNQPVKPNAIEMLKAQAKLSKVKE